MRNDANASFSSVTSAELQKEEQTKAHFWPPSQQVQEEEGEFIC